MDRNTIICLFAIYFSLTAVVIRSHVFDWHGKLVGRYAGRPCPVEFNLTWSPKENIFLSFLWPISLPMFLIFRFVFWIIRLALTE